MHPRTIALAGFIAVAATSRLVPHPPNFTPVLSMALFAGTWFPNLRTALLTLGVSMFLSDLVLGFHSLMPLTYGCIAATALLGRITLRPTSNWSRIILASVAAVALFFTVTNLGVWLTSTTLYPKTAAGLTACYAAAVPFALNQLLGTLFYSALLFGGLRAAEWRWPVLRPVSGLACMK